MPTTALSLKATLQALAVAVISSQVSFAADSGRLAASEFRLSVAAPDTYRLAKAASSTPPSSANPEVSRQLADKPYAALIERAARDAALDPALVHAVIHVESRYNQAARSPKGALGLMQVLPETASRYGVSNPARSIEGNLKAGTSYLRDLMALFDGRLDLVLAAYNAGENAVLRYGQRLPPYRETQLYVPAVLDKYRESQPAAARLRNRVEYLPGTLLDDAAKPNLRP